MRSLVDRGIALAALSALVVGLSVRVSVAQEFRGTILGSVTDPSGAVVAGAKVAVTGEATGARVEVQSNPEGNYHVPFLLPGRYTVEVESAGFRRLIREGIIVQVNDRITLNLSLELGATADAVNVTADSPLLQTANADLGQVVDRHFVDRLPIAARNPMTLVDLAPGVLGSSGDYGTDGQTQIAINGGSGGRGGNEITVDGIPNTNPRGGARVVTVPISDAVEEFKVHTTMFDASYGRSNAGALTFSTRSGTNRYHGSVHDYFRNRALNANSWSRNRLGQTKPVESYNLWGGTLGGPVRIPGWLGPLAYDGRDKTFFFLYYEDSLRKNPGGPLDRVPTAAERQGDFSQTLAPKGAQLQIYDPFSTRVSGSTVTRTPFPGARIPAGMLNPVGVAVLSLYPLPNLDVPTRINAYNWTASNPTKIETGNLGLRVDQVIGARHRLFGRYSTVNRYQGKDPNYFVGRYNDDFIRRLFQTVALDDSILISPTLFASLRYGYARTVLELWKDGKDRDPATLKLPDIIVRNQATAGWPRFNLGESLPQIGGRYRKPTNDTHALLATLNQLVGRHTLKFGADYRLIRWNDFNPGEYGPGTFTFNSVFTRSDPERSTTSDTSGTAMASLLLGLPASGGLGYVSPLSLQSHYLGAFLQDDIKLTPKLTLNLGLRYEVETPFTERYDRISYGFDEKAAVPVSVPGMEIRGGILFVNQGGLPRRQGKVDRNNFGPRFGFAYAVRPKTVFRGGYGVFFSSGIVNQQDQDPVRIRSFDATTQYVASIDGNRKPFTTISDPFPNGLSQPTGTQLGLATELGNSIEFLDPNRTLPYIQQWQFGLQREMGWQTVVEAAYVGVHSLRLFGSYDLNQKPDQFLALGAAENTSVPNPFYGVFPATSTLGQGRTSTQGRLWVRFPQFTSVTMNGVNAGRALYHGLQVRLQKRLSHGLAWVVNYTSSKTLEYDPYSLVNERHYRTVSDVDRPQVLRLFATCELPVGRKRALGAGWPRWLDLVAGGWEASGVLRLTSGEPLSIAERRGRPVPLRNPRLSGSVKDRLGDHLDPVTRLPMNPYFDTGAWQALASDYVISPEPPRLDWLRGPRERLLTLALRKLFRFSETADLEIRAEIDNPTNTPAFGNPGTNMSGPTTFGVITSGGGPRTFQVGAKLKF
ncbi:MAG: TonB-dependent receptor [Acidobacteria bacterium]|nr:TonB-dependent receptor [Acidobacteriota bacterium]